MTRTTRGVERQWFRVWITTYRRWRPRHWNDVPPAVEAVEPADDRCLNAADARQFIEGFNRRMLERRDPHWAVAVPVVVRIDGDPRRGRTLRTPALPAPR
jgi:hypothetical protein